MTLYKYSLVWGSQNIKSIKWGESVLEQGAEKNTGT